MKWRQNLHEELFLEVTFLKYFSGNFERTRAKFLRTPKNLPATTPLVLQYAGKMLHFHENSLE